MKINYHNRTIHCFFCKKDLGLDKVFLNILFETSITCKKDHILGYTYDKEWIWLTSSCPYLVLDHNELRCKCEFELNSGEWAKVDCEGIDENCNFPLGRRSYNEDLEDDKKDNILL